MPPVKRLLVRSEVLLERLDGVALHLDLLVERTKREIIRGHVGLQAEQHVFVVGEARLRLVARRLERPAHLAPDVDLVAEIEGHHRRRGEGVGTGPGRAAAGRAHAAAAAGFSQELAVVARGPLPFAAALEIERRIKIGLGLPRDGAGLAHAGDGGAQVLVGALGLFLQLVQLGIVKNGVPVALGNVVARIALLPVAVLLVARGRFLVAGRLGDRGLDIIGPDAAPAKQGGGAT